MLAGVAPGAVSLARNGSDVTLVIAESAPGAGDGGSILLSAILDESNDRGVEAIRFDDGTAWSRTDLRRLVIAAESTAGADTVTGFNTYDTLRGGGYPRMAA